MPDMRLMRAGIHVCFIKTQMPVVSTTTGICRVYAVYFAAKISRIRFAASEGVLPTFTPAASRASFFA